MQACFSLDKLSRLEFTQLAGDMKLLAMARLKNASIANDAEAAEKLLDIIEILEKTDIYSTYNVGVGHITGLFMAGLV